VKEKVKQEEDKFMNELNLQMKPTITASPLKNEKIESLQKQEVSPTPNKIGNPSNKGSNEKVTKKVEKYVDPKLVPDGHKNLFRALKNDGSGSSDEDLKGKKIPTFEPQAIRPTKMPSKQFFGFKNTFKDGEFQEHSNPNLMYPNYSIPPKFLFNNESDPQQMNVSNNSNLTHSFMFQNFDFHSLPGKNKVNFSKPTDINVDYLNPPPKPNISNFTASMFPKSDSRPPVIEKDRNVQINLSIQGGSSLAPHSAHTKLVDLNKLAEPLNIATMRGKKLTIEVQENGNLLISQCDSLGVVNTNNTSNPKDMSRPNFDERGSPNAAHNSQIFQNNKFGNYIKRVASNSDAMNSNKSETESIMLQRAQGGYNMETKLGEAGNNQPRFNFNTSTFRNAQL